MPVINCPSCGLVWRTADREGAYSVRCHDCGTTVEVRSQGATDRMPRSHQAPVVVPPFEDSRTVREAPPPPVATQPRERTRERPGPRRDEYEPEPRPVLGIVLLVTFVLVGLVVLGSIMMWILLPSSEPASKSTEVAAGKTPNQPARPNPPAPNPPAPDKPPDKPAARDKPPPLDKPRAPERPPRQRDPAPSPKAPDKPTEDETFNQAFADLQSPNPFTRKHAAEKLQTIPPNANREEVAGLLVKMLEDSVGRNAAAETLGIWGTKDDGPAVMKLLDHGDIWTSKAAITVLGKLRYEPAAPALADRMADFHQRREVTTALKQLGAAGEKPLHKYLDAKDIFLCRDVCDLLKDIGTRESVRPLESLAASDDFHVKFHVRPNAEAALKAIKQREMK